MPKFFRIVFNFVMSLETILMEHGAFILRIRFTGRLLSRFGERKQLRVLNAVRLFLIVCGGAEHMPRIFFIYI